MRAMNKYVCLCYKNMPRTSSSNRLPQQPKTGSMQGFCVSCKDSRHMKETLQKVAKNGRNMVQGVCDECGTKMSKFVSNATTQNKAN